MNDKCSEEVLRANTMFEIFAECTTMRDASATILPLTLCLEHVFSR